MARLEISAGKIAHNLEQITSKISADSKHSARLIAILKDNAYGHGAAFMAGLLRDFGLSMCAVKNEREAAELRGFFSDILILSQPARLARGGMGIYAVNELDDLQHLRGEKIMLKIDSGMCRSGIKPEQIPAAISAAKTQGCTLLGAFTHYASVAQIAQQQAVYAQALRDYLSAARAQNMLNAKADRLAICARFAAAPLTQRAPEISENSPVLGKLVDDSAASSAAAVGEFAEVEGAFFHSAASFGVFAGAAALDGAARVGLALYGHAHESLQPCERLIAERLSTRLLQPGDTVGYDAAYTAQMPITSSNYDLGYADGLPFYNGAQPLELGGARVLGKFSMDSLSLAASAQEICIYEDACEFAAKFGISVYEALVRLAPWIERKLVP